MEKTVRELQGISCIDLENDEVAKKQIISSRSYGSPVYEIDDIKSSVRLYVARAVKRMREDGALCKMIGVFIQTGRFDKTEDIHLTLWFKCMNTLMICFTSPKQP